MKISIVPAQPSDVKEILSFIHELAVYEKLEDQVTANETLLLKNLFGYKPSAEVIFIKEDDVKVGIAIFFHNFSTFLGQPGIYLEDLFVKPDYRGKNYGKRLLSHLAQLTIDRNCGRLEWSVLDWNTPALDFYKSLGSAPLNDWTVQRLSGDALKNLASFSDY